MAGYQGTISTIYSASLKQSAFIQAGVELTDEVVANVYALY